MGLLQTLRSAFGWRPPLVVRAPDAPLGLTEAARARLGALPAGHGAHVETVPAERGRLVRVTEGESQGPPPPALGDARLSIGDRDLRRLAGRELDYRDGRWLLHVGLELRAQETPNPDARLYSCDHPLAVGRPLFFVRPDPREGPAPPQPTGDEPPDLVVRLLATPAIRAVLLRDNTVNVERAPGTPWEEVDAAVDAAIREHLLLCGEPAEGGAGAATGDGSLEDEIRAVIAERIAPAVHRDGGDVELVGVSNGVVKVSMMGACRSCPSSTATLHHGIERTLVEAFPGRVVRVEQI